MAVGTSAAAQEGPSLARLANGQMAVAWPTSETGTQQIKVQRYDDSGAPVGAAVRVDAASEVPTFPGGPQSTSIAATPDGYVVSWCAFRDRLAGAAGRPAPGWDAYLRRFDASGAPLGGVVQVNVEPAHRCSVPSVVAIGDGKLGVTYYSWQFLFMPGFLPGKCLVRTFTAAGIGSDVTSLGDADSNCVAGALPDGGFSVVFDRPHYVGAEGVFLQRFDVGGAKVGDEAFIDGTPRTTALPGFANANQPDVATLPDGNLVIAWITDGTMVAQKFTGSGVPLGPRFPVPASGVRPRVAAMPGGGFALAWSRGTAKTYEVWSQAFDAAGVAREQAGRVMSASNGDRPAGFDVAASSNGRFITGWQEPGAGGSYNVFIGRR
ncbi:MAG: hypothetical protein ACJ8GO_01525 [Ramlibacter sp.]